MALTARARLAAVYVALVAAAGSALVALTYLLVRRRPVNGITHVNGRPGNPTTSPERLPSLSELRNETLDQLLVQSLIALSMVMVLAGVLGWVVAGRLLRPIRAISRTARRVSATNLSERVATTGPADELTILADTVNGMLDRVQHGVAERDRLLHSHRLFVANAAHELRTPLTTMRTAIDVTLDGEPSRTELYAMITDVSAAVDASQRILDGLLALARSQTGSIRVEYLDLAGTAAEAVDQARAEASRRHITLTAHLQPAPMRGEAILLLRLLGNLIDNGLRYNHPDGEIQVSTRSDEHTSGLRVTNTGPPVHPADLSSLFQPFVRGSGTRVRAGGGVGLGLSIVHAITTAHEGAITSSAPATGGLDITIAFPRRNANSGTG